VLVSGVASLTLLETRSQSNGTNGQKSMPPALVIIANCPFFHFVPTAATFNNWTRVQLICRREGATLALAHAPSTHTGTTWTSHGWRQSRLVVDAALHTNTQSQTNAMFVA
jgi:hypothetical protein